jgi:hypothetical protein
LVIAGLLGVVGAVYAGAVLVSRTADALFAREATLANELAEKIRRERVILTERSVPYGADLQGLLEKSGVDRATAIAVHLAARSVFDLRRFRAGNRIALGRSVDGDLRLVRYRIDPERTLEIVAPLESPLGFRADIKNVSATVETFAVRGEIRDSLFDAVVDAGERPELALQLAEIFGWDLDFHTDPRRGDTFRVAVEKKTYADGSVRYTQVFAAEYVNAGHAYRAVLFRGPAGKAAYYAPDGSSLEKAFLRSPLKFSAPVTSRFSRSRLHPVLKVRRAHLGVDYGAPYGAPVQAIGDGQVTFAGSKGANGRMVHLRHANGYETMYLHLSRILVRPGQRVTQGQLVGLVGSTGLATGPHLDFRITQFGQYRNFEALRLPPARPVAKRDWSDFVALRDARLALLPDPQPAPTPTAP